MELKDYSVDGEDGGGDVGEVARDRDVDVDEVLEVCLFSCYPVMGRLPGCHPGLLPPDLEFRGCATAVFNVCPVEDRFTSVSFCSSFVLQDFSESFHSDGFSPVVQEVVVFRFLSFNPFSFALVGMWWSVAGG